MTELLEGVSEVVKEGCGLMWDGVCLAVAMPQSITPYLEKSDDEWEEVCQEYGFEFVDFDKKGRNEYSGMYSFPVSISMTDLSRTDGLGTSQGSLGSK